MIQRDIWSHNFQSSQISKLRLSRRGSISLFSLLSLIIPFFVNHAHAHTGITNSSPLLSEDPDTYGFTDKSGPTLTGLEKEFKSALRVRSVTSTHEISLSSVCAEMSDTINYPMLVACISSLKSHASLPTASESPAGHMDSGKIAWQKAEPQSRKNPGLTTVIVIMGVIFGILSGIVLIVTLVPKYIFPIRQNNNNDDFKGQDLKRKFLWFGSETAISSTPSLPEPTHCRQQFTHLPPPINRPTISITQPTIPIDQPNIPMHEQTFQHDNGVDTWLNRFKTRTYLKAYSILGTLGRPVSIEELPQHVSERRSPAHSYPIVSVSGSYVSTPESIITERLALLNGPQATHAPQNDRITWSSMPPHRAKSKRGGRSSVSQNIRPSGYYSSRGSGITKGKSSKSLRSQKSRESSMWSSEFEHDGVNEWRASASTLASYYKMGRYNSMA